MGPLYAIRKKHGEPRTSPPGHRAAGRVSALPARDDGARYAGVRPSGFLKHAAITRFPY